MVLLTERIKEACAARGLSLEDLASKAGLKYHSVYRYTRGTEPGLVAALKLAKGLGMSLDELAEGLDDEASDAPQPPPTVKAPDKQHPKEGLKKPPGSIRLPRPAA